MKKILPIPLTDYQKVPAKTPTGKISKTRYTWELVKLADEQECESFEVALNGKQVTVWVPIKTINDSVKFDFRFKHSVVYTEAGEKIMANWQHGRYGTEVHTEPALFNWEKKEFVRTTDYCDGRVKDSYKYLLKVIL